MRPMSEQEQYNEALANMKLKLAPHSELKKLFKESKKLESYDPIANAMKRHPKLTEEEAEAMAKAFGF